MKTLIVALAVAVGSSLALGCVPESSLDGYESADDLESALGLTGYEADLILDLVNAPETTREVLDIDVGLDRRAAENIVARRAAAGPFRSIAELDAVAYVGDSALTKLRDYALVHAPPPPEVVEGVEFDAGEVAAVLAGVNAATVKELDIDVGLAKNAATNLVAGAPYASIAEIGAVKYVGPAALMALRDYAPNWMEEAPSSGTIPDGEQCNATSECMDDLVCAGTTVYGYGFCRPSWMAGTFTNDADVSIPDTGAAIESTIVVTGLASVPEDVIVHLDIDHPRPQDLRVVLHQPSGGEDTLWAPGSSGAAVVSAGWGIERDAAVNGTWTLTVVDTKAGYAGVLRGWSLELTSRWD